MKGGIESNMEFTFGLLLFNQEKYVIETLESIKYQIVHYGKNIQCDLILNDDKSSDNSLYYARMWLNINKNLFRNIIVHDLKQNLGTVIGQQFIIDNCKTKNYKILACDDVLSSKNIFECFDLLDDKTIKSYLRLELLNGHLQVNDEVLTKSFYLRKMKEHQIAMRKGNYLHTPSTIYQKKLYYSSNCSDLNSQFTLFEDDPTWYQMIKNTTGLQLDFVDEVIVLYRISNSSVSNSIKKNTIFSKELKKLSLIYEADSKGVERLYFKSRNSNLPKYLRVDKYLDCVYRKIYKCYCTNSKEYKQLIRNIKMIIEREQLYYDSIKEIADDFMKKIKGDQIS